MTPNIGQAADSTVSSSHGSGLGAGGGRCGYGAGVGPRSPVLCCFCGQWCTAGGWAAVGPPPLYGESQGANMGVADSLSGPQI